MAASEASKPRSALLVITQRIGDVLLATPMIASLKNTWPDIAIDALVFLGTESVLEGNSALRDIITVARSETLVSRLVCLHRIWRRYDVALSPITGDRPILYAWAAGRRRFAPIRTDSYREAWKRLILTRSLPFDDRLIHTVRMGLKTAELCGARPVAEVQVPGNEEHTRTTKAWIDCALRGHPFVLLHPNPRFNYKKWHARGWRDLANWLLNLGYQVVVTGSGEESEVAYVREIFPRFPVGVHDRVGKHSLGEISALLSHAALFVGPDTVTTHMAAALGTPTVALFGPSNPIKWGPWPKDHDGTTDPYVMLGTQHVGNVVLVQGSGDCVPCMMEGCDRNVASESRCLVDLPLDQVQKAINVLLVTTCIRS